ncbi:1-phosphatidylinositol 4,5-bisphosphate phosphodiesterase gamma-1-like [Paramacrobiotus metropolitanus]|uniref:1-phosphatidylinositol 4,5-bisphosphate phosphodiesterase gamma-1-like n=1 Tax=Paramacrobiotus metropolitanus TaxID=2943436 RepID=UPI002445F0EA|nr:1-phosphatidylinositol 4,5-bisphosphate phosphodiesterase gamma-1-like [Paramacrobiotus metropolitanus]
MTLDDMLDHFADAGVVLTKFYPKRRPEKRLFVIRKESRQLGWSAHLQHFRSKPLEGLVDIRDIKELRKDKISREFERVAEDAKRFLFPLVIHYGAEFRLATISCAAESRQTLDDFHKILQSLMQDVEKAKSLPYSLHLERWLSKEFHQRGHRMCINFVDTKNFLYRANCKVQTGRLKDLFQELDTSGRGEINFNAFVAICCKLLTVEQYFLDCFGNYSGNRQTVNDKEFQRFLLTEQHESWAKRDGKVVELMNQFQYGLRRSSDEPSFNTTEAMNYLFSRQNTIWDSTHDRITQDMDQPLTHYWIASSHNTYLTGNSLTSDSAVEAYARCLRMGCRCIELDTWDGQDDQPWIYHGHTLTSRIKFSDVVECIRDHAFVTSDYPVILSIEDHCSLPRQRKMAETFRSVLGDLLLTEPFDMNEKLMPSPNQLKRKIIIKHKKLPEGVETLIRTPVTLKEDDSFRDSLEALDVSLYRNGIMFLQEHGSHEWLPHYFVLTATRLSYMEKPPDDENGHTQTMEEGNEENEFSQEPDLRESAEDLHLAENWFHGKLPEPAREKAVELILQHAHLGDGTFLVRQSSTFVGDYSLSFLRKGDVHHCRIHYKPEAVNTNGSCSGDGTINVTDRKLGPRRSTKYKYYLVERKSFDSLYDLVSYYKKNPLKSAKFDIILAHPVPQPEAHRHKSWYHENVSRVTADIILQRLALNGAFLVRRSETSEADCPRYAISFRADKQNKHCRVARDGRLYLLGSMQFESLVDMVEHFEKTPLVKDVRLKIPITPELLKRVDLQAEIVNGEIVPQDKDSSSLDAEYFNPNFVVTCEALFAYTAQRPDELTFPKGARINNVYKAEGQWWKGDYELEQRWFPSNYVREITDDDQRRDSYISYGENTIFGAQQKGSFDVTDCVLHELPGGVSGKQFVFRLTMFPDRPRPEAVDLACESADDMHHWVNAIRQGVDISKEQSRLTFGQEVKVNCARELSDLIVYCRSGVPFDPYRTDFDFRCMSSFSETKVEKWLTPANCKTFLKYNQTRFSRIYPMGKRVNSSNYDPTRMWNCGSQMVALNYQTPDAPMHLNQGRFMQNGKCGYVLQPAFMRNENYDPYNALTLKGIVEPIVLSVTVVAGRHLLKSGKGISSPLVEVEVTGADYDCNKFRTDMINDNGFNPFWNETCDFDIRNPDLALIRFIVLDIDMFNDQHLVGQATFPVRCIRQGFRSVPLKNGWSEDLELSSLLVRIQIKTLTEEDSDLYQEIQQLRHEKRDLTRQIDELEHSGQKTDTLQAELREKNKQLSVKSEERQHKSNVQPPQKKRVAKKLSSISSVTSTMSGLFSSSFSSGYSGSVS